MQSIKRKPESFLLLYIKMRENYSMYLSAWRKRLAKVWQKLYLYPAPEPFVYTRLSWFAFGLITLATLFFCAFFLVYLTRGQSAYLTNAEDMGIMDQALWNTLHGQILHQTVCNILSDTNCYGPQGLMRFAIHVEPILFPLSLLYLLWPDPKTLLVVQTLVVVSGAFPAFWLARLRLRNDLAAVAIALLYLLYPAQQAALVDDFHAVTFTAALLLFALYFLYMRRTWGLFLFAILAMACKEEIPLLVVCIGIWSIVFQRRWRSGLALTCLALCWAIVALIVVPRLYSPTGQAMLAARYSGLGSGPVDMLKNLLLHPITALKENVFEPSRLFYLRALVMPAGLLPLLTPWVFVMTLPTLAVNLLSSNNQMHSGLAFYQYDAEIVPILIFATIESIVLFLMLSQRFFTYVFAKESVRHTILVSSRKSFPYNNLKRILLALLSIYLLTLVIHYDMLQGPLPISKEYAWPTITAHNTLAQTFIKAIPPTASVSAQSALVPHVSHRTDIYLFPYGDGVTTPAYASYIFLDMTSDPYPYDDVSTYKSEVDKVLHSGVYDLMQQQDGYMLLKLSHPALPATLSTYPLGRRPESGVVPLHWMQWAMLNF
jgi:uncharacterized membrane protein